MSDERIHSLIPGARAEPNPALGQISAEELLAYVLNSKQVWWRRETIARFWRGDLPAACVSPLIALVMERSETTEVRVAVLDALCLTCEGDDRAKLGDITALRDLARVAHDPWTHTRVQGIEGLGILTEQLGHRVEDAGLVWIGEELGQTTFTGLCVYYFGRREPLSVRDLLFYWQD